ncbi:MULTISPECIES: CdaR family transcriptional regulator [unclassified Bacillus (in: firmicutes)]|uniref:PucR family transcriptional regulator n=1 Tax=unclassified Bacillus (in: firmicutes) TaxID=185979 RepID=UPI0008F4346F|nr:MULTISPECIES: PucR family transcriptional regulator [unclassified Bacillus (in: firmicutes)]SFA80219.1 DNA-binding transcriptional regulator, PucR family [Bacillus sp. UNCCL13]SFQ70271.1 DNA-binding transcriptional regulator, PucR family [Bacillus sp. cl95]
MNHIQLLYPEAIISKEFPTDNFSNYHYFRNHQDQSWLLIPKNGIGEKELKLLSLLYEHVEKSAISTMNIHTKEWYDFLYNEGPFPIQQSQKEMRFIHFFIENQQLEREELESAIKGFLPEQAIIIWEFDNRGIIIEENSAVSLSEKEYQMMSETFEADFFAKTFFFIGKFHELAFKTPSLIKQDKEFFDFSLSFLKNERMLSFEKVFPSYLAHHLREDIKGKMDNELLKIFKDDPEMHITIKTFLENNLNASMTAKHLYIHRNTLQYRLDKFTEKTGIHLKDFHSAFTVFIASLISNSEIK